MPELFGLTAGRCAPGAWALALLLGWAAATATPARAEPPPGGGDPPSDSQGAKAFFDPKRGGVVFPEAEAQVPQSRAEEREPAEKEPARTAGGAPDRSGRSGPSPPATPPPAVVPAAGSATAEAAPGVRYWIEIETPGGSTQVTAHREFRAGDRIRLHLYSNVAGNVVVSYVGSTGKAARWLPPSDAGESAVAVPAYGELSLPPPGSWLRFDDNPGVERVFVIFSIEKGGIDSLPLGPRPAPEAVTRLASLAASARGSKDMLWETDEGSPGAVGTYAVSLAGEPLIIEIPLRHR